MKRERFVQLLKAGSPLVALVTVAPLIVVILWLTACVKHPVGDPEKSRVDPAYSGVWLEQESNGDRSFLFLRPYDARTYFANIFTYGSDGDELKPKQRINCKAWLTPIGGDLPDAGAVELRAFRGPGRQAALPGCEGQLGGRCVAVAIGERGS